MRARQTLDRIKEAAEKMRPKSFEWQTEELTPREAAILPLVMARYDAAEKHPSYPVVITSTDIVADMKAKGIMAGIEHDAGTTEFYNDVSACLSGIAAKHENDGVLFIIYRVIIGGANNGSA